MKTNKKLKLNTKKVVILSDDQQNAVQGGQTLGCTAYCYTDPGSGCYTDNNCGTGGGTGGGNTQGCDPYHTRVIECMF